MLPLIVRMNAGPPAVAEVGLTPVALGTGFTVVILNMTGLEIPPPGRGLKTVTVALSGLTMSLADIEAVSRVALPNIVDRFEPFQRTTDAETKLLPLTMREKDAPPAKAELGLRPVIFGTGFEAVIVKATELEIPPPGEGLKTVTAALPALAMSPAGMEAVNWLALPKVVERFEPFQRTTDEEMKLLPFTVRVKAAPLAAAEVGVMPVTFGTGFAAVIVNVTEFEIPPPGDGLKTVKAALPALPMSPAGIEAVNWLALPKVVERFEPFQRNSDVGIKPLPLTVRVKDGLPAGMDVGLMLVIVGTGFGSLMVKSTEFELPIKVVKTVMAAVPALAMSLAGISAVSLLKLTKVVGRSAPFQRTTDRGVRLLPFTVRVKAGPPARAEVGLMLEILGVKT